MEQKIPKLTVEEFTELIRKVVQDVLTKSQKLDSFVNDFMDVKEAAKFLNLAVNTVYEKTSEKTIPHYKYGNKLMFKRSELIAWVEGGRVTTVVDMQLDMLRHVKK